MESKSLRNCDFQIQRRTDEQKNIITNHKFDYKEKHLAIAQVQTVTNRIDGCTKIAENMSKVLFVTFGKFCYQVFKHRERAACIEKV